MNSKRLLVVIGCLAISAPAMAQTSFLAADDSSATNARARWMAGLTFRGDDGTTAPVDLISSTSATSAQRPVVFEYSEGYQTRLKIHKIASLATIPLFVAEGMLGQSLYNNPTPGKRTAHLWVGYGMVGLFGLNTVTGVWNLTEAKNDPNGRGRRLTHSILMLAADAGFLATAMTGPGHHFRDPGAYESSRSLHRTLAFTSITLASVGYAIVLFPH